VLLFEKWTWWFNKIPFKKIKGNIIFITKNGYGDLVVMSIETSERQMALVEIYKKLAESEAQVVQEVPMLDGKEVFKKLRAKYAK